MKVMVRFGGSGRGLREPGKLAVRATVALVAVLAIGPSAHADELEAAFVHPPASARPWVNWFWLDGNITREGITADLEAMQRVGIGGVLLMDVAQDIPPGPVTFGGDEWRALFKHTVMEADRLGLEVSLHNAPGWCGSGGPWITPELGMQKVVSSRTNVVGPGHWRGLLPGLPGARNSGREIATLAFPTLVGEGAEVPGFSPKITTSAAGALDAAKLLDANSATFITLPVPAKRRPLELQLEFTSPFTASTLRLAGTAHRQSFEGILEVSDDGRAFRKVREFISLRSSIALTFEPVSARYFRILFTRADPRLEHLEFSDLELAPAFRIDLAQSKAGLSRLPVSADTASLPVVPPYCAIGLDRILDLTTNLRAGGWLDWEVPRGKWTVLRLGSIPTGQGNHPAREGGLGLECDKLSRQALDVHFNAFLGQVIRDVGNLAGRSLIATHIDSWENGFQNWTPQFRDEFRLRRGYDPLRYLPAFSGRIVGSLAQSERFLWDVRRTIADLLADNYAGGLAQRAHEHGLQLSIEAYGNGPFDDLQYAGRADVPMAEFWLGANDFSTFECREMPSAAHTYGKRIVAAEAFTSYPEYAKWQNHPFSLKPLGDAAFCEGINRLVIHRYAHQPWLDRRPGMSMGQWGVHYERTQTWWEQSSAWHQYLARCQFLLQQGLFAADICYLTDEGAFTQAPLKTKLQPTLPEGYDFDLAAPEIVLSRMSVRDGLLNLPDGMRYGVLVLPPNPLMTPRLLRKIKELVVSGATIMGPRPLASPSLTDYPHCDAEVKDLAEQLWGACDGTHVREHPFGKGRIIWGEPLHEVLVRSGLPPDFQELTKPSTYPLHWIHRTVDGAEIYFVANLNREAMEGECRFRVKGKRPEFWHPDTGSIEDATVWHEEKTATCARLQLAAGGSVFVVFRKSSTSVDPVVKMTRDGHEDGAAQLSRSEGGELELRAARAGVYQVKTSSGRTLEGRIAALPEPLVLSGPWDLHFPAGWGAPVHVEFENLMSWTRHNTPGVQFFSGTATYAKHFELPADFASEEHLLYVDLGKVLVLAELEVNGRDLGILWKPPFRADITQVVKAGVNLIKVKITNLWPNRLIGDEQLPEDCLWRTNGTGYGQPLAQWPEWLLSGKSSPAGRFTFATWKHWSKDSPLLDSGLLGPVTISVMGKTRLRSADK